MLGVKEDMMIQDIINTIEYYLADSERGLDKLKTRYWFGRLSMSKDFKRDVMNIINKYLEEMGEDGK